MMAEEAQRMAIAEVCGWREIKPWKNGEWGGWRSDWPTNKKPLTTRKEPVEYLGRVPDYTTDLNAMREAEKVLSEDQELTYRVELQEMFSYSVHSPTPAIRATAPQRAEAFLKTIGKWRDGE